MTTIEDARIRLEAAEQIQEELAGNRPHNSLQIHFVGDYVVVDDGTLICTNHACRWLCTRWDWDYECEQLISRVLEGELKPDPGYHGHPADAIEWYNELCGSCDDIYCTLSNRDLQTVADLDEDEEIIRELFDLLYADYDEWLEENTEEMKR